MLITRHRTLMLTYDQMLALHRTLRDRRVLSVYIDGSANDPALQRAWRVQLDHALDDLRRWLDDSGRDERAELEQCIRLLDETLMPITGNVGASGWAAFITADQVHLAQSVPVPTPTLAVWSTGASLAAYLRAFKESRNVMVVVADATQATLYSYRFGELRREDVLRAHAIVDKPDHMGAPARVGFHTGTRGETGHDAAQRTLLEGRDRMIGEAAERVRRLAGDDSWILLGGIDRVAARFERLLEPHAAGRILRLGSLDVHASEAEITEAARAGASRLRDAAANRRISELLDLAAARGLAAAGREDASRALEQACVRELYISHRYLENHAAEAEQAIRAALDQNASVEEVERDVADRLDKHGGMAVALRFRPPIDLAVA